MEIEESTLTGNRYLLRKILVPYMNSILALEIGNMAYMGTIVTRYD